MQLVPNLRTYQKNFKLDAHSKEICVYCSSWLKIWFQATVNATVLTTVAFKCFRVHSQLYCETNHEMKNKAGRQCQWRIRSTNSVFPVFWIWSIPGLQRVPPSLSLSSVFTGRLDRDCFFGRFVCFLKLDISNDPTYNFCMFCHFFLSFAREAHIN